MHEKTNIVVIILDTLRAADVGCYGNEHIRTPHMDALAGRSVRFTRAFPESLPTIPVRRAIHTGRRAYPFRNYKHMQWGTVRLPGWQPIAEDEDTLAENLASAGYQTGFVCTTQHCWNPGFNFHRGFWQWELVRGYSGEDRWGSPFSVPLEALSGYGDPDTLLERPHIGMGAPMVLGNRGATQTGGADLGLVDEETPTARAFQWAARFLKDNQKEPFYLLIDSFAPHEPWDSPEKYYRMYGDPDYSGARHFSSCYGPADVYSDEEIANMRAHYRGLVTHVDHWLGTFVDTLEQLGLSEKTAILLISDHGTNFCENPRNVIGKPPNSMYPGLMQLAFLVKMPQDSGAGQVRDEIVYNFDLTATVYDLTGIESAQSISGQSLCPLCGGNGNWERREYATCRYADCLWHADDSIWALGSIDGTYQEVFDIKADPECRAPLAQEEAVPLWDRAWRRLLSDAGGEFPDCRTSQATDALGRGKSDGTS